MAQPLTTDDVRDRMDRMYRPQKLVYDLTRKYYLIGRDRLIDEMEPPPGACILELGCGTARNLRRIARRYPQARLFGLEPAPAMLEVARAKLRAAGLADRVRLAAGTAEELDPAAIFGVAGFDDVVISYTLSMIDEPGAAIDRAIAALTPRGRLHIVDFGPMTGLPAAARAPLRRWLELFGVHYKPEVARHLATLAGDGRRLEVVSLLGGYADLLRLTPLRALSPP